jgi:hypothetical protein
VLLTPAHWPKQTSKLGTSALRQLSENSRPLNNVGYGLVCIWAGCSSSTSMLFELLGISWGGWVPYTMKWRQWRVRGGMVVGGALYDISAIRIVM